MPTATAAPPPLSAGAGGLFAEGDLPEDGGEDRARAQPHWVSLDARTGRLLCPSLGLAADRLTGRITGSRLVRVFGTGHGKDGEAEHHEEECGEEDGALCASGDRRVADLGRPGRECAGCEERHGPCTPRWRIAWEGCEEETGSGLALARIRFAHTLSAAGTVQFTRYALALRRAGLLLPEVLTVISAEALRLPGAGKTRWCLRFERADMGG